MWKAFFMRAWGDTAFWNELWVWETEAGGLLLLCNVSRAFYSTLVSPFSLCSGCKLFEAGSVHVCSGQEKELLILAWLCRWNSDNYQCCLDPALAMVPTGIRRLENQGYLTLNLLLPHTGWGSPSEQCESGAVIRRCLYGRALGRLLFPLLLSVAVTPVAHIATL